MTTTKNATRSGRHEIIEVDGRWFFRPAGGEAISGGFTAPERALAAAEGFECNDDEEAKYWARLARPEEPKREADGDVYDIFAEGV